MTPWRTGEGKEARDGRDSGFNAARAMTPWRTGAPPPGGRRCTPSFNAATAMTPWRTGYLASCPPAWGLLQCGHGDDAVENVSGIWYTHCPFTASMRPRR